MVCLVFLWDLLVVWGGDLGVGRGVEVLVDEFWGFLVRLFGVWRWKGVWG